MLLAIPASGCDSDDNATTTACVTTAPEALRVCIGELNEAVEACYQSSDAACQSDDPNVTAALVALAQTVESNCADGDFGSLSVDAVVGRLQNACSSESASLAWRTYGGPQGAVWLETSDDEQACLASAHQTISTMVDEALAAINTCLASGECSDAAVAAERQALIDSAVSDIEAACQDLAALIAVSPSTYVDRAVHQVDCITATGHADTGSLALSCGPSNADFEAPRGEYVQVVVDGDKWGTLCGDGTPYAFQVRLAPEGERLDRIIIGLEGGGVCAFEEDCGARFESNPQLFNALDNEPPAAGGIASNDPAESPFADWTKVFLPYCNQDVFAGGGVTEELGALQLPRYGSVNLRAAVRMVRDVIWKLMDEEGGAGFRPDELIALFGGWSAGGYGTLYNYHWLLDDLQWPRTAAFPDAGGALDNGEVLGVRGLGVLKVPAWGAMPNLPPYCFAGDCALGPVLYEAISPRLKQVPEQQFLILSNQKDNTQQRDSFFDDEATFINTMRQSYCDTKDLNGINYYYTSVSSESVHVVSIRPELWVGEVDGEVMRDWFWRAVTEPDTLQSRVEEGDFVEVIEGVESFPCEVAP
ncbi:MAG: hypothetical protein AMJ62_03985 [Myxococcales bacterium SG8_38]|nr:MAG: hypothetical protein AMJ62_03985 [Myxococcales bacterium SG8_38]